MSLVPTGRLDGTDLELTRTFDAPLDDVWSSVTDSTRTADWFGPWEGDGRPGGKIRVRMAFEEGGPWMDMTVDACEAPRRLAVSSTQWRMEILLDEVDGSTRLRFVHHLDDTGGVGDIGPGWEYYLDGLVASREGRAMPSFDDYYPSMKGYYEALR